MIVLTGTSSVAWDLGALVIKWAERHWEMGVSGAFLYLALASGWTPSSPLLLLQITAEFA